MTWLAEVAGSTPGCWVKGTREGNSEYLIHLPSPPPPPFLARLLSSPLPSLTPSRLYACYGALGTPRPFGGGHGVAWQEP